MSEPHDSEGTSKFATSFAKHWLLYVFCGIALGYLHFYPLVISAFGLQETVFADLYVYWSILVFLICTLGVLGYFACRKDGEVGSLGAFVRAKLKELGPLFFIAVAMGLLLTLGHEFLTEQTGSEDLSMILVFALLVVLIVGFRRLTKHTANRNGAAGETD
jgi:hypothetical protein